MNLDKNINDLKFSHRDSATKYEEEVQVTEGDELSFEEKIDVTVF